MIKTPHSTVRAPRFDLCFRVLIDPVQTPKGGDSEPAPFMGSTLNISRSGMCFELSENQKKKAKIKIGELVNLTLILENKPSKREDRTNYPISLNEFIVLKGIITWSRDSMYGFHIVSINEENKNRFNILVDSYEVIEEYIPPTIDMVKKAA